VKGPERLCRVETGKKVSRGPCDGSLAPRSCWCYDMGVSDQIAGTGPGYAGVWE
jgi:hypothetical protein